MGPTHPVEVGLKRRLVRVHKDFDRLSCEHRDSLESGKWCSRAIFQQWRWRKRNRGTGPRQKLSYPDGQPTNHPVSLGASRQGEILACCQRHTEQKEAGEDLAPSHLCSPRPASRCAPMQSLNRPVTDSRDLTYIMSSLTVKM
jgi:hypothetical protein